MFVVPVTYRDRAEVEQFIRAHWGAEIVVAHGTVYHPADLPGFVARRGGAIMGLITYHLAGDAGEIVTINSLQPGQGLGSALIEAVAEVARQAGCRRLWLITTNDNLDALRFYQRRGFRLVRLSPGAVNHSRALKPGIPLIGAYGIPITDELELERELLPLK